MNRAEFDGFLQAKWQSFYHDHELESEIERAFYWAAHKHINTSARLVAQVAIPTLGGAFRGDFVLHTPGLNTLIECDGAAFHSDPFDDDLRSAFILGTGLIDQVIRFNGVMLLHSPDDGGLLLHLVHPAGFEHNAKGVLPLKASVAIQEALVKADGPSWRLNYEVQVLPNKEEYGLDGELIYRPAAFESRFDRADAVSGRVGELLTVLRYAQPRSKRHLETLYWGMRKQPDGELMTAVRAAQGLGPDKPLGPGW